MTRRETTNIIRFIFLDGLLFLPFTASAWLSTLTTLSSMRQSLSPLDTRRRHANVGHFARNREHLSVFQLSQDNIVEQSTPRLDLLTFDLDDTLFPCGEVVESANQVMIQALRNYGATDVTIPDFLATTKGIRRGLTEPITYRDLRKRTIRQTLLDAKEAQKQESLLTNMVEDCYNAWVEERHAAADRMIFEDAVTTLQAIKQAHPNACLVAITNGAGDPDKMPNSLKPYFDFRVSGEDDDVFPHRKPHPFIYEYTLEQYYVWKKEQEQYHQDDSSISWCHVGDCLANDVGASASVGAQAIWMCTEDDEELAASRLVDPKQVPQYSTASVEELERRAKKIAAGRDAISATISSLSELTQALESILSTQTQHSAGAKESTTAS